MTEEAAKRTICQLLELSDTLENIILKENELLDKRRPRELTRFRKDKEQIGWEYHSIMSTLKSDPSALANANPSDIATLKSLQPKLLQRDYLRQFGMKLLNAGTPVQAIPQKLLWPPLVPTLELQLSQWPSTRLYDFAALDWGC